MSRSPRPTHADRRALAPGGLCISAPRRHVALVGMMGAGKSTVGRLLAASLGRPFVDTDQRVEEQAGMPVPRIFERLGESAFRKLEGRVLAGLAAAAPSVLAVGGGLVTIPANARLLRAIARCIYLEAPAADLAARIGPAAAQARPVLRRGAPGSSMEDRLNALLVERQKAYETTCDLLVSTSGLTPEQTASLIAHALPRLA